VPLVGFASVLALPAAGLAPTRLRPAAVFFAMTAFAPKVCLATVRLLARLARRIRLDNLSPIAEKRRILIASCAIDDHRTCYDFGRG
jgi:hypothetical protein